MNNKNSFLSSIPVVTKNLIIINLLVWLASVVLKKYHVDLVAVLGLHLPVAPDFYFFQFISYMFMHDTSSIGHVFFNMFAVFMFGRTLETVWGPKRFLIFYLVTGIGAGIVQELVWVYSLWDLLSSDIGMVNIGSAVITKAEYLNYFVTIGASGAVFGILLAFGMLFPNVPIYIMFIPIPIKAKYFVIGYGLIELFAGIFPGAGDNVAHFAHLGGMLFGYILIRYWKKKGQQNGRHFY